MAIEIREYVGATFAEQTHHSINPINLTESAHYSNRVAPNSLMVDIEGLHSVVTRNDTFYTDEAMRDSEKYWTHPYERPVIMHHNEKDGITIGRVKRAYWTDKNTRSGTGALRFVTNIGHKEGLEGINNGSLSTVSVGLIAHDVRCSICGKQIELDMDGHPECGHYKGASYDGKHCYWVIHKFEPKELSFVIVPSDPYAHILRVYKPDSKDLNLSENNNNQEVNNMFENPFMDLIEESAESIKDLAEASKKSTEEEIETKTKKEEEEVSDTNNVQSDSDKEEEKEEETTQEPACDEKESSETEEETVEEVVEEDTKEATEEDTKEEESKEETEEKPENTEEETTSNSKVIEEEVKKDIDSKKEDIYKDIEVKLQQAETENKELKDEIANLKKEVANITSKLQKEKSLKESAEAELMEFRMERKKNLAEQVNALRKTASLEPEKIENLMEASEDALHFTIKNLKEFSSKMGDLSKIQKLQSEVSISESKDNSQKTNSSQDVKEKKANSNINLEENMEAAVLDILSRAFGGF